MSARESSHPRSHAESQARLIVLVGPEAGLRYDLARTAAVLGRAADSALALDDCGVSRRHAEIRRRADATWEIEDLGSRNGTSVNGVQVQQSELRIGDRIKLGPGVLLLFTDRDTVESALFERQRFELLGRLAAGVAHDFNNVLTVVGAGTGYLRTVIADPAAQPEEEACLDDLDAAVANGARLSSRLLGFARGSQQGQRVVDATRVFREIAQLCRRAFDASIRMAVSVDAGLSVLADEGELEQILMNLCVNARDSMPSGGTLTVRACERLPTAAAAQRLAFAGPYVVLTVEDAGSGIDPSDVPRIFEPFFSTKHAGAGFGLGLSTVNELVAAHGGIVEVESELGKGALFRVYLPTARHFAARTEAVPKTAPTRVPDDEPRCVLLVDDDELVRRTTARLLNRAGFEVDAFSSGRAAIERYRRSPRPSLVIVDLDMPELSGIETLSELRRFDASARVLLVSAHRQPSREQAARAAGARLLGKPFDPAALVDAVRALGRGELARFDDEPTAPLAPGAEAGSGSTAS